MRKRRLAALVLASVLLAGCAPENSSSSSLSGSASSAGEVSGATEFVQGDPAFGVKADWSRLEGKRSEVQPDVDGGRWYPEYTDHLIPREDYGPLVPYLGETAYSFQRWEDDAGETQKFWTGWASSFYGLMTQEGKIVVDPVYQQAWPYSYRWQGEDLALPVLLLARADPAWEDSGGKRYAVAAEDGSWTTGFEFINYTNKDDQLLLLGLQGVTQLDSATGARKDWAWDELGVPEEQLSETLGDIQWGMGWNWTDHGAFLGWKPLEEGEHGVAVDTIPVRVFQPETGEVSWVDGKQWDAWYDEYFDQRMSQEWHLTQKGDELTLSLDGQSYTIPDAPLDCRPYMVQVKGEYVTLSREESYTLHRLSTGEQLLEGEYISFLSDPMHPERLGCVSVQSAAHYTIYDSNLNPVLALPRPREDVWLDLSLRDGLLSCEENQSFFGCWDLEAGRYVFYRSLGLGD